MAIVQSAGAKLFIGDTTECDTIEDYEMVAWTEVGEVENFGEFGKAYQLVTFNPVGDKRTRKFKGAYNEGAISLVLGRSPDDSGQAALRVAVDDPRSYNFKITLDDDPGVTGSNPTTFYFAGKAMSYTINLADVNAVVRSTATIEIDSDILEQAASDGSSG